mmetsp:Transcript_24274/g.74830  ORF Transcript_24274/g.74830 Transcript_24274/m.74830 type:complete len:355 (+) Transcript_24274:221-1285(+)
MIDALNPWHYFWRVVLSLCLCESLFLFPRILVGDAVKDETRNLDILSLKIVNVYHAIVVGPIAAYYLVFGYLAGGDGPDEALTAAVSRAVALDASAAPALFSGGLAQEPAAYLTSITVGFFIWDLARLEIWPPSRGPRGKRFTARRVDAGPGTRPRRVDGLSQVGRRRARAHGRAPRRLHLGLADRGAQRRRGAVPPALPVHGAIVAVPAVAVVRAVPLRPRLGRRRRRVRRFRARVLYSSVVERARRAPRGARRADVLRGDAPRRARVRPVARPRGYVCSTRARASSSFVRPVRETPRAPARGRREAASGVVACSSRPRDAAAPPRSLAFRARLGRSGRAGISAPPRRACPRF